MAPAEDLAKGEQLESHGRDDSETALAPTQCPEEVGVGVGRDRDRPIGRSDDVDGSHVATAEAEATGEWAHTAAQQVARDADTRGRAAHGGESVRRRGRKHRIPGAPGADPGGTGGGVHLHAVQAADRERQNCADVVQTAMAGTEDRHRLSAVRRNGNGRRYVGRGLGIDHDSGRHDDRGGEPGHGLVIPGRTGLEDANHAGSQDHLTVTDEVERCAERVGFPGEKRSR